MQNATGGDGPVSGPSDNTSFRGNGNGHDNAIASSSGSRDVNNTASTSALEDGDVSEPEGQPYSTHRKKSQSHSQTDEPANRVQLACLHCRSKRIRCNGHKPTCAACEKSAAICEWPSGRRRKRTRKEMEEAKRIEAEAMRVIGMGVAHGQFGVQGQPDGARGVGMGQVETSGSRQLLEGPHPGPQANEARAQASQSTNQQTKSTTSGRTSHQPMLPPLPLPNPPNAPVPDPPIPLDNNPNPNFAYPNLFDIPSFDPDLWSFSNSNATPGPSNGPGANATGQGEASAQIQATNNSSGNFVWPSGFTPENTSFTQNPNDPLEPTMRQFMASPATDMRLMSALENQAAFIQGNPGEDEDLELFYYRFSGATAVQPGIHRISLKLQRRNNDQSPLTAAPQSDHLSIPRTPVLEIFDSTGMPMMHVWEPLFELFLTNMSQHFPSVSRMRMQERFETGTMSQFLASCICACAARFAPDAKDRQTQACAPFIAKAQELIIPLVHLPNTEATTGLLMLAWANFGQNSESGLWQYSGMSIRMGIDIGIHENSEVYESPAHVVRTRHLFWTLFVTDRVVAFATGRPASIPEDIIEIPLPEDKDFFPDPSRNTPGYPAEPIEPVPFVYFVRLIIICGRISNVLNGRRGRARTLVNAAEPLAEQLAELQMKLVQFVANLPPTLKWSADNFKRQHSRGHGGAFLSLHLWAHAVLALVYHPELLKSPSGIDTPLNRGMNRNIKLSLASSRQICECMVFADLVAPSSYISTPFIVQPLFVASMALIHEMRGVQAAESSGNPTDVFLLSMARQNLSALMTAIGTMEQYWAGTSYVAQILEKRFKSTNAPGQTRKTFISLPDSGLLRRFTTDKDHPKDVAPATQTSLRESIAKSERQKSSPFWLSDLMAGYTVENTTFAPVDSWDIERLLAGGAMGGGPGASWGMSGATTNIQGQGQSQG